jgi:hypothetical protein
MFYGNLLWFIGIMNFSLHASEKYDTASSDCNHDDRQKPEKEPGGAAEPLLAGLGDAEGPEEGGRNGFKESHVLMVRAGKRLNP